MEQVVLVVHLILAVCLIAVVLLQRSEGGALGMGGGGGGGLVSSRGAATALSKATWFLATSFIVTSLALTVLAAQQRGASAVIEAGEQPIAPFDNDLPFTPSLPNIDSAPVTPPSDAPLAPPPIE